MVTTINDPLNDTKLDNEVAKIGTIYLLMKVLETKLDVSYQHLFESKCAHYTF